ncbi:hypothetical protein QIU18_03275 [Capnocytophaga canimorsus]|nr:hypothetical protein [Capnocytophaga canimorsus]WGU67852.1 hypothetical protein QIU19_10515 [Capnocytophaga canimorsus]WGU71032.1 hypothetical protein QIU18_03275 [Capnocytophaga canimorsus]
MITNVLQNNKTLYIYDEDDQISAKIMLDENDFLGVGTDFFVLKKNIHNAYGRRDNISFGKISN